ncbi:MAG TPA: autotransporter domain-containing protein [Xanthobacteraceae bacterium]|nr:autotransporter domain-containing protein [Xanthobacteraceae bacterium]
MASSSCAALLLAGGGATAACYTGPFPVTNNAALSCITVSGTSFSGNVVNSGSGTISPGSGTGAGILVTNASTVAGQISNAGSISVSGDGIRVDANSVVTDGIFNSGQINISAIASGIHLLGISSFGGGITNTGLISSAGIGINIFASTFTGDIVNSGTIAAQGIVVENMVSFGGSITNSHVISSAGVGIDIDVITTFAGGITNSGTLSAAGGGILLGDISSFGGNILNQGTIHSSLQAITFSSVGIFGTSAGGGNITNSGLITASRTAIAINNVSLFAGGITNTGQVTAALGAIALSNISTFAGGITNASGGVISAGTQAIALNNVGTFSGGISNAGTLSGAGGNAAVLVSTFTTFSGGIHNSGLISSASFGIRVTSSGAAAAQFSGGISNSGTIASGNNLFGIAVLSFSTFSGDVSNSGTLAGGGIAIQDLSVFAGSVINSNTISSVNDAIDLDAITTVTGGITNSGAISASATAVIVAEVSSFAGNIVNRGTIQSLQNGIFISGNGVFGSALAAGITNTGLITAGHTGILVENNSLFTGGITNGGTISAGLAGIMITSTSTFLGAIVNSGNITGATAAIDVSGAGNAITINQNAGTITGAIKLSPNGDFLNISGGVINGNVVGQGNGFVNFNLGAGTFTYASPFAMTALGFANINSGTVLVDGSIAATTIDVNNGGTAAGTGTLAGAVNVLSGGTLMPGQPLGTLNVSGSITFNVGSTYAVHITPSASSATSITGAPGRATINGGIVTVTPQVGHYNATQYVIVATTGGRSGAFSGLSVNGAFTGTMTLDYSNPNDVLLDVGAGFSLFSLPLGANQNQQNVLNGINNAILAGDTLPSGFAGLSNLSNSGLLNALTQLSGQNGTGFFQGAFQAGNSFLGLMVNPYVDGRFGNGFGPAIGFARGEPPALPQAAAAFASAMPVKAPPPTFDQRFSAWGAAYGGSGSVRGDPFVGSSTTTATAAAFAAGIDYRASPDTILGFALAGGGTSWGLDSGLGGGRSDMFQAGLYGSQRWGNAYLSGALAYNFHDATTNRTVTIAGTDLLQGRFQANGVGARVEGGYRYGMPWLSVTPYAAAQVQSIFLPSYGETATAGSNQFALNFASQTATTTRSELGGWLDHSTLLERGRLLTLYGRLAWAHDFGDTPRASAIFQALPGSNFIVNGAAPARDGALVTTGAKYDFMNGWSFTAKFDGEFSSTTAIYSGTGLVRKVW